MIPAFSIMRITVRSGARVRCKVPFGTTNPCRGGQRHDPVFQVDQELPFDDIEKLIIVGVFVPVILAANHAQTYDRAIYAAERLVIPGMSGRAGERLLVDHFERLKTKIEMRVVRISLGVAHGLLSFGGSGV
jgi:hypothetical protein